MRGCYDIDTCDKDRGLKMTKETAAIARVKKVKFDRYGVLGIDSTNDMCYDLRIDKGTPMRYLATCLRELADMIDKGSSND